MRNSINKFMNDPDNNSDECFNFYDWFCKDSALEKRMYSMLPKLRFLMKEGIINADKNYVWFKNNCPLDGSLYDDMRFSSLNEDETFRGGVCPRTGHRNVQNKCSVWYFTKDDIVQKEFKDWNSFKKEIKNNSSLKEELIKGFKGEM